MSNRSEQEALWAGQFGREYTARNSNDAAVGSNIALFSRILERTGPLRSVLELGANTGLNLRALHHLLPEAAFTAVDINPDAVKHLQGLPRVTAHCQSILEFKPDGRWDLVLTKGVLIHIQPDLLGEVYSLMYRCAERFLCVAEYYNPSPVEVPYRGHVGMLFKRDFAGELLDRFPHLRLVDYGFVYRRDPTFPQDDLTWFLLEKTHPQ